MTDAVAAARELADKTLDVIEAHTQVPSQRRRPGWHSYMHLCSCGWEGYPHSDHQTLQMGKMLLQEFVFGVDPGADEKLMTERCCVCDDELGLSIMCQAEGDPVSRLYCQECAPSRSNGSVGVSETRKKPQ